MHANIFTIALALAAPLASALSTSPDAADIVNADAVTAREAVDHPRSLNRRGAGGKCNGTSCQIKAFGFIKYNYSCDVGKCVGNGGGDGAGCHQDNGKIYCPNRG